MKRRVIVMGLGCFVFSLMGCQKIDLVTSHFGHGQFRCYYYNDRSHESFIGTSGDKEQAESEARNACLQAGYGGEKACYMADCHFK